MKFITKYTFLIFIITFILITTANAYSLDCWDDDGTSIFGWDGDGYEFIGYIGNEYNSELSKNDKYKKEVAIALPDNQDHRNLIKKIYPAIKKVGIKIFFVKKNSVRLL